MDVDYHTLLSISVELVLRGFDHLCGTSSVDNRMPWFGLTNTFLLRTLEYSLGPCDCSGNMDYGRIFIRFSMMPLIHCNEVNLESNAWRSSRLRVSFHGCHEPRTGTMPTFSFFTLSQTRMSSLFILKLSTLRLRKFQTGKELRTCCISGGRSGP